MEFRLGLLHLGRQTEYRRSYDAWLGDRLLGIFFAVATGKLTEQSRDAIMKHASAYREKLYTLLSLVESVPDAPEELQQPQGDAVTKYVQLLGKDGGFSSLEDIVNAVEGLNAAISEAKNSNADTGSGQ